MTDVGPATRAWEQQRDREHEMFDKAGLETARRPIFVVDWDGVCCEAVWPEWGEWLPGAVDSLKELLKHGEVRIYSSRINPYKFGFDGVELRDPATTKLDVNTMRLLLNEKGLHDVKIHTTHGKPTGTYYIDDRAVAFTGDWNAVLEAVGVRERPSEPLLDQGKTTKYTDPVTQGSKEISEARYDLLPPDSITELARVYGYGEGKYPSGPDGPNYLRGYPYHLSIRSIFSHVFKFVFGEDLDPETRCHHLAHAAWHCMTLIAFQKRGLGTDNRKKKEA